MDIKEIKEIVKKIDDLSNIFGYWLVLLGIVILIAI